MAANKSTMQATSKGNCSLALPPSATQCHRIPNLHMPLLSVGQHCNTGNTVIFTATKMEMVKNTDIDIQLSAPPTYKASLAGQALWLAHIPPPIITVLSSCLFSFTKQTMPTINPPKYPWLNFCILLLAALLNLPFAKPLTMGSLPPGQNSQVTSLENISLFLSHPSWDT